MLKILIVEDEPILAVTLKHLIELNPRFEVTRIVDDLQGAMEAVDERRPDLALVDLQLAHGSDGFSVAVRLNERDVSCLFTTGKAPPFPLPELALGCLCKPYTEEDVVRALKAAEDRLRGRERLRPSLPDNLTIYGDSVAADPLVPEKIFLDLRRFTPPPRSIRARLSRWLAAG